MRNLLVLFGASLALAAQVPEVRTTAKDRMALSVTIYQNDLAAVRDTRRVHLPKGPSRLAFADLLPSLRPKSAVLLDPGHGLQVRERNFEFNLLSPASLLDASLGLPVRIKGEDGKPDLSGIQISLPLQHPPFRAGAKPLERIARLPQAFVQPPDPGVVVQSADGTRAALPAELAFKGIPPELRSSPTLVQGLEIDVDGTRDLTLLYTATHLSWTAAYVARLASDGKHLDLEAFATVNNPGAELLPNTTLQLVAGEPNTIWDPPERKAFSVDATTVEVVASAIAGPPVFKEEKLSEFPLFTFDRPVTLGAHSSKQLHLFSAKRIPLASRFLIQQPYEDYTGSPSALLVGPLFQAEPAHPGFSPVPLAGRLASPDGETTRSQSDLFEREWPSGQWRLRHHPKVQRLATFKNTRASRLGRALPLGSLTLRYQDPFGALVLLPGEGDSGSTFPQTPPGEEVELMLGPARGFRVERKGLAAEVRPADPLSDGQERLRPQRRWAYTVEVRIANDRPETASVTVREPVQAGGEVLRKTHPGHRSGENAWDFEVPLPAHGEAILRYTALTPPESVPESSE
ncbi:DUF4139 domain-containing protein [Geothrix sp. SG200]|uniref:DUF4139 domain-containing protein n=1 Tax=Geothrix sp. SG200 TaxID=2922865 RepID=UPI001FACA390|nr:DUF4139 domain-containing protein [Geothrix sp. SG200]